MQQNQMLRLFDTVKCVREDHTNDLTLDVPSFDFEGILAKKLVRGGFGPVYKGELLGGKEIAVKRLYVRTTFRGIQECGAIDRETFQHLNLVRILGYSVHQNEKLLIYEYLANGSLDSFIFG